MLFKGLPVIYILLSTLPILTTEDESWRLNLNELTNENYSSVFKPVFVIKTFYYQNSKTNNGSDSAVTLFSGESYKQYNEYNFTCWRVLKDGTSERSLGKVIDLAISPSKCKVGVMRLTCNFPINDAELSDFSVGVTPESGKTQFQQLTVTEPNKKPYKFVACMSRMVAVDDWATFILAMETFRHYGGNLAVTGVECAMKQIMDLMRLYEKDGILKIQPAFKPKPIPELDYNPQLFTEYASQIANAHECFYEFKESAEFISFPDWDDLLTNYPQTNGPTNYYDLFSKLAHENPHAASFNLDRLDTRLLMPIHESEEFSVSKILKKAQMRSEPYPPKIVIRPQYVASVWIHSARIFEAAFHEIKTKAASFIHLHHTMLTKDNAIRPLDLEHNFTFADGDVLESNFQSMLKRHSFEFKTTDYPFDRLFYNLMRGCYFKMGLDSKKNTYCPTHAMCKFEPQNVTVVKTLTTYKDTVTSGPFVWVERSNAEFVAADDGCL